MNIFLEPRASSVQSFDSIANCLALHKPDIDESLTDVAKLLPATDRSFYHPLRLGGIVLGMPPFDDPSYLNIIKTLWGETETIRALPDYGSFTLFPGQSAKGVVNGHSILLTVDVNDEANLYVDDVLITYPSTYTGNLTISTGGRGWWVIGRGFCTRRLRDCQKQLMEMTVNDDRSVSFRVYMLVDANTFLDPAPRG